METINCKKSKLKWVLFRKCGRYGLLDDAMFLGSSTPSYYNLPNLVIVYYKFTYLYTEYLQRKANEF
jgi:hypothetical protein